MPKDLRTFIDSLSEEHPNEIVRVARPVDPAWEIAAVVRRFQAENQFPTLLFEDVKGSSMPVMTNLFASRLKLAAALDVPVEETFGGPSAPRASPRRASCLRPPRSSTPSMTPWVSG